MCVEYYNPVNRHKQPTSMLYVIKLDRDIVGLSTY